MRRRDFITVLTGVAGYSQLAGAQQKAMPVIGFLSTGAPGQAKLTTAAFHQGLSDTSYIEGKNVTIEYRWAEGSYDRLPALAADLVARKVDVIAVVGGGDVASRVAKNATSTIPIIFIGGGDPVAAGLVASLARPGGNLTGVSFIGVELAPKRLELLSDLVPQAKVVGLLVNPTGPNAEAIIRDMQEAARTKGLQLHVLEASAEAEFETAFAALRRLHAGALVVAADPFFGNRREELQAMAARHAIPAIYAFREYAAAGGLMSYGPSLSGTYRQAGAYVGRILSGAKPADLPMQQPTKFELVINLKTANALGLTVPQSLLARADEVIE
jgi:putative tryptophan/tyrosine transport system substrate-binding protein